MDDCCESCGSPLSQADLEVVETSGSKQQLCSSCRILTVDSDTIESDDLPTRTYTPPAGPDVKIAHFKLVRLLGRGGFGEVWQAEDTKLARLVALKLTNPNRPGGSTLLYEAKTAASLRHANIVAVYEVGEEKGQVYIASELIEGMTLRDFLSKERPAVERVIELLIPIVNALQFAHEHGVVHRDIKPANILMNDAGVPFVTDFGIAKRLSAEETISSEGQIIGTMRYMSPEQAGGKTRETDARSDIYAVGVMMFEMLTSESPFRGNARAILEQKIVDDAPSPRRLVSSIPRDLETICLKCLEREPGKRYTNASDLAEELQRFADGEPIRSRPISRVERGWRWCKKRPAVSSLVLSLFLSLAIGLAGVTFYWLQSEQNAAAAHESLYRSWMNLIAVRLQGGDREGVRDLLNRIEADPDLKAMRGFGWYYHKARIEQTTAIGSVGAPVIGLAISNDGNYVAATAGEQQIQLWEKRTGELRRMIEAEQDGFTTISLSPTTTTLAAGSIDGNVRFYEPLRDAACRAQRHHGPPVKFIAHSPDGKYCVSAGARGALRVWDESFHKIAEIPTGKVGETRAIRFSSSGLFYVARDDGLVREWSVANAVELGLEKTPTPLRQFRTNDNVVAMAITDDGEALVVGCRDSTVIVSSLVADHPEEKATSYQTHWGLIREMEFLPSSRLLAFTTSTGNAYVYDVESGAELNSVNSHALTTGKLARSGSGGHLVVGSGDGVVSLLEKKDLQRPSILWNEAPPREDETLIPNGARNVTFVPGSQRVLASYDEGEVISWNIETGERKLLLKRATNTTLLAIDPHGKLCATAGPRAGLEIREARTFALQVELPAAKAGVSAMTFSESGDLFVEAVREGPVRIYDVNDWTTPKFEIEAVDQSAQSLAVSNDDRYLAIARGESSVELFDLKTGESNAAISLGGDAAMTVRFCADERTLAVGTNFGTIYLIDQRTWQIRATIKGHAGRISALITLPKSNIIVTGGRDKRLKLWDLDSGELVTPLVGHFRQVFTIASSADGSTLVSGGLEGDLRIWRGG